MRSRSASTRLSTVLRMSNDDVRRRIPFSSTRRLGDGSASDALRFWKPGRITCRCVRFRFRSVPFRYVSFRFVRS
jgi:hypothetical protein